MGVFCHGVYCGLRIILMILARGGEQPALLSVFKTLRPTATCCNVAIIHSMGTLAKINSICGVELTAS